MKTALNGRKRREEGNIPAYVAFLRARSESIHFEYRHMFPVPARFDRWYFLNRHVDVHKNGLAWFCIAVSNQPFCRPKLVETQRPAQ